MRFWDASAVVPILVNESMTRVLRTVLEEDPHIAVWWGTRVECISALARRAREAITDPAIELQGQHELDDLAADWSEIQPINAVRGLAEHLLTTHPLRVGDALQLAAALVWTGQAPRGRAFVCLDSRLRQAAHKEGFTVLP